MVVRVPDSFGDIFPKGNIKIPCQCYYNARDNILTEILQHSYNSKNTIEHEFEKGHKNALEKKSVETETLPEPCCVCEYYRNLEKRKNRKDLWNMQFNRWWGWNWQRKRKDFLSKFKSKEKNCTCPANSSKQEAPNLNKQICNCHSYCPVHEGEISSHNCKTKSFVSPQIHGNPELAESLHPMPPATTYGFKIPYTGRRRRNKKKQRLYEGWIREISSESDNSVKSVNIKMTSPKISTNNKDYMHYLSLRIRNLNSDESIDEDKKIEYEDNKIQSEIEEKIPADSKYISPISGKYYNLNLPEVSNPFTEINDTEYLQPLDIKNEEIIPKPEYDWIKHYNMMKEEHSELLKSIGEVLCTPKIRKIESEKEIRNFHYSDSKFSEIKSASKDNCVQEPENKIEEPIQIYDLPNPYLNYKHRSERIISPTNPFYECTLVKSSNNYSKSFNLPSYKPVEQLLISKSSNLFYQDAVEQQIKQNINEEIEAVEESTEDCNDKNLNYDINYISNNLQSFASTISDTDFLICRTEISNLNITEDMSERVLQEIDLFKE